LPVGNSSVQLHIHVLAGKIYFLLEAQKSPSNAFLLECTCQVTSKSVEPFTQGARVSVTDDDRQTDHATEK